MPKAITKSAPNINTKKNVDDVKVIDFIKSYISYLGYNYNPDDYAGRQGIYKYDDLDRKDEQVKFCTMLRDNSFVAPGWYIEPFDEKDPESLRQAEFVKWNFTEFFEGNFENALKAIFGAYRVGFVGCTKFHKYIEEGEWKGLIGLKRITDYHPRMFYFDIDEYGQLKDDGVRVGMFSGPTNPAYNKKDFIINVYPRVEYNNWYGNGLYRTVVRAVKAKEAMLRYRNLIGEIKALGRAIIYVKDSGSMFSKEIKDVVDLIINGAVGIAPKDIVDNIEFPNVSPANIDDYNKIIDSMDRAITTGLLMPYLLANQGADKGGSYALTDRHYDSYTTIIRGETRTVEDVFHEQCMVPWIKANFPNPRPPKLKMHELKSGDLTAKVSGLTQLMTAGAIRPGEKWVRQFVDLPADAGESEDYAKPTPPEAEENGQKEAAVPGFTAGKDNNQPTGAEKGQEKPGAEEKQAKEKSLADAETVKAKHTHIDWVRLADDWNNVEKQAGDDVQGILQEAQTELVNNFSNLVKRHGLDQKGFDRIVNEITFNRAPLQTYLSDYMKLGALNGAADLNNELVTKAGMRTGEKQLADPVDPKKKKIPVGKIAIAGKIIKPEEALRYFEGKNFGMTLDYYGVLGKRRAADIQAAILSETKYAIEQGIKTGNIEATKLNIKAVFDKYLSTDYTGNDHSKDYRVNTLVRTNWTDAYNQGYVQASKSDAIGDFVEAYEYVAILDDRTTEFCEEHSGQILRKGDPELEQITPPNHFNAILEGVFITTDKGDKFIENIKIGDMVLTHKNNYKEVYDVMSKFEDKEYIEIELEDGKKIKITAEHPVYTERGWIPAGELNMCDNIITLEDILNVNN